MMNFRISAAAAIAVAAASLSLYAVIQGNGWMGAGLGAIVVVAGAGALTRMSTLRATIAATAAVLIASIPLLVGAGWLGLAGGVVLLAITAASATGARLLRGLALLLTYCACLLIYLNDIFASAYSYGNIIPSPASLASLSHMPSLASAEFGFSPPVPGTRAVDFFAAAGIGIVAIIVDITAVKLRRPAPAGLPLLLLFSVPVASNLKGFGFAQTLTFAASISAYLALLSSDGRQRLRMWGRLVTVRRVAAPDETDSAPDTRQLAASGRRVGVAAVGLAMLVPVALIGAKPHDLFSQSGPGSGGSSVGSGPSTESPLNAIGNLLTETPRVALTYTTSAANPDYLQQYALNYNAQDNDWVPPNTEVGSARGQQLPAAVPGLAGGAPVSTVTTHIHLNSPTSPLPVPYAPVKLIVANSAVAETSQTLIVTAGGDPTNFTVVSKEVKPTKDDFNTSDGYPQQIVNEYGSYGRSAPDQTRLQAIAYAVTNGDSGTTLQDAIDLQNWFTKSGQFTYTLKPNLPDNRHWLLDFLTKDKRGECQQFAFAFAVLARILGIPARIAVGYTEGMQTSPGHWTVTTADAHAWPELYFPGVGWVRFEPTPSGANGQGTAYAPAYSLGTGSTGSTTALPPGQAGTTGPSPSTKTNGLGSKLKHQLGGPGLVGSAGHHGSGGFPLGWVILLIIAALLASPALARWATSRRRWLAAAGDAALAHTAWRELTDYLTDYGQSGQPSESPRALACRVAESARLAPAPRAALTRIGAAEERARYSLRTEPGGGLRADVAMVRKALADSSARSQRLRARLLPASTLDYLRRAVQSVNQALSWIDSPVSLRRRHGDATGSHAG